MNLFRWHSTLGLAIVLAIASAMHAQQNTPRAGYVYPAGGRQGTTFEVTVGGQFMDGVHDVYVSGTGVQATLVEFFKPLTGMQATDLREQLQKLREKRTAAVQQRQSQDPGKVTWSAEDERMIAEIRDKLTMSQRRSLNPAISQTATLRVTIAPDAVVGDRELRLATTAGLTNPLVFCVDQLPEFSGKTAQVGVLPGAGGAPVPRQQPKTSTPPTSITLPVIVNGQIMSGGVERYSFQAHKGQHLVIAAKARQLIPYISDAVPGWFQASLALYDSRGNQVASADHYRFHQDPVLYHEISDDGEYMLEVKDSIYRGREDFVYRIALGELPFVTGIFPLGGKTGSRTSVETTGWNLPVAKVAQSSKGTGTKPLSVRAGEWSSNTVPFAVDKLKECKAAESNHTARNAQRLKLPITVNGRLGQPGEWDVFRFEGRAGEEIVAEVFARRLDSPLDSVLKLTDAAGKQLAFNDDNEDKGAALITHQADSYIFLKLPATGTYYLYLGDSQHNGGSEYAYRLRISHPSPDFELRVVPSSISLRPGMTVPITVYALRRDGFSGDIALRLKDAPRGVELSGGLIPGNQEKVRVTLTAPPQPTDKPQKLYLEGEASIEGRTVRHEGVPAEDMMQAFAWHHLVPQKDSLVLVSGAKRPIPWKLQDDKTTRLPAGGTALVRVHILAGDPSTQIHLALNEPPDGITIQSVSRVDEGLAILLRADAGKVKPGLRGNLVVDVFLERAARGRQPAPPRANNRRAVSTLPAIPFEVVGP